MKDLSPSIIIVLIVVAFVFIGYVVYPIGMMGVKSLGGGDGLSLIHYVGLFDAGNTANLEAIWNSVYVSLLSVVMSGLIGILFAIVFTQFDFPLRKSLSRVVIIPIALPPLVGVISFLFVFGESGMLPRLLQSIIGLGEAPFALDGIAAIIVVHAYSFYVYFYLLVSDSLRRLDASVIEAATNLGSSTIRIFRKIILPEIRPSLFGASLLTFMASMASFTAPLLFGADKRFMTLQIYNAKLNGDMESAAALSILLACISLIFFFALRLNERPLAYAYRRKGTGRQGVIGFGRMARKVLLVAAFGLIVLEMLPVFTIILISFIKEGSWTWQVLPSTYSLDNYAKLFSDTTTIDPIANSIVMSALAFLAVILIGFSISYLITRGIRGRMQLFADFFANMSFAIPGTVIAIALILAFNTPDIFGGFQVLVGSFWILPLAYFIRLYPLVVRSTSAALVSLDESLIEAGSALGAGFWYRLRRIVLPLVFSSVISGGVLMLIAALGEFVSSILLYTYSNRPISVEILSQMRMFNFGGAAVYSVLLLVVIVLLIFVAGKLERKLSVSSTGLNL